MKSATHSPALSARAIYWTAFIGLFFDYYDLYLFVYLERTLAAAFSLSPAQSSWLQFSGLAGVGLGALGFGYVADRWGRARTLLTVFAVYLIGIAWLSLAGSFTSLLIARIVASLALGAEWGISHTLLAERVRGPARYRYSALLQFALLGGLLAALMTKYVLPSWGWRALFAASLVPIALLSLARWRALLAPGAESGPPAPQLASGEMRRRLRQNLAPFALCLSIASLSIASGTVNVFFVKELPQATWATVLFWANVVPGMLLGAWLVPRLGVPRSLALYALALTALSLVTWSSAWPARKLIFALTLAFLNGVPFGLMGAYFNEVFGVYRTLFSGAAYNLGRILAGFSPVLLTSLGLQTGGRYFLFTAVLGVGLLLLSLLTRRLRRPLVEGEDVGPAR